MRPWHTSLIETFKKARRNQPTSGRPRQQRLSVEALEDRQLLTILGGSLGWTVHEIKYTYSLQQSNLYETDLSGRQTLIDSNVKSMTFSSPGGASTLFDLTYGGTVKEWNGNGWTALTGGNTQAATLVSTDKALYMMASNGGNEAVWQWTGWGTNWTPLTGSNTSVSALALSNGGLYMMASNGGGQMVWQYSGPGTNWNLLPLTYSFSVQSDGSVAFTDWFSRNLNDVSLQNLARTDFQRDGGLGYADMLGLFRQAESEGTVSSAELQSLRTLVANAGTLQMPTSVAALASKVVNGDPGNAWFESLDAAGQAHSIYLYTWGGGVLSSWTTVSVGSSNVPLTNLVNKYFLGMDYPLAAVNYSAAPINTPLTAHTVSDRHGTTPVFRYDAVAQGQEGDCWIMASLAEIALRDPGTLQGMFTYDGTNTVNGDEVGVWTVRLYPNGSPDYLTVDTELPGGGNYYDHITHANADGSQSTELWAALAEKAFAQEQSRFSLALKQSTYDNLNGGKANWALAEITGRAAGQISTDDVLKSWNLGQSVVLGTKDLGNGMMINGTNVISTHAYAVLDYNAATQQMTLFNPHGSNYRTVTGTWQQLQAAFTYAGSVGAAPSDFTERSHQDGGSARPGVAGTPEIPPAGRQIQGTDGKPRWFSTQSAQTADPLSGWSKIEAASVPDSPSASPAPTSALPVGLQDQALSNSPETKGQESGLRAGSTLVGEGKAVPETRDRVLVQDHPGASWEIDTPVAERDRVWLEFRL